MSNIKRITIWVFLLIGGSFLFYLWSMARILEINEDVSMVDNYVVLPKKDIIEDIYYTYSSSTSFQILLERGLDKNIWSTSTLIISTSTIDDKDFEFIFPNSKSVIYTGCTYNIELDLGLDIKPNYIGVKLVDFGTQKDVGIKSSGLINSLTIKDSVFRWSVGDIWPGYYYLFIPMIDGVDVKIKSQKFRIETGINNEEC